MILLGGLLTIVMAASLKRDTEAGSDPPATIDPEKLRLWEVLRELIVHEDALVNQRLTWLFAIHAFIVGGFFIVQADVLKSRLPPWSVSAAEGILATACLCALITSRTTRRTICSAYAQIAFARRAWERKYPEEIWVTLPLDFKARDPYVVVDKWPEVDDHRQRVPDLPNIAGSYKVKKPFITEFIPELLLYLDALLIVTCLAMIGFSHFKPELIYPKAAIDPRPEIHFHLR